MKTTTIPAQITTVEDKIAGSLNLTQLMPLRAPIFLSGGLYILFPPFLKLSAIKIFIFICLVVIFATLSIRVKGKLLLSWLVVISRYNLRPRYYIYNKNDAYLRDVNTVPKVQPKTALAAKPQPKVAKLPRLSVPKLVQLQTAIADPRSNLSFRANRKGGLSVHITEIK